MLNFRGIDNHPEVGWKIYTPGSTNTAGWKMGAPLKEEVFPIKNGGYSSHRELLVEPEARISRIQWNHKTRWWQLKHFWNFHPQPWGRFEPILTVRIFFKGVGKNHQLGIINVSTPPSHVNQWLFGESQLGRKMGDS